MSPKEWKNGKISEKQQNDEDSQNIIYSLEREKIFLNDNIFI